MAMVTELSDATKNTLPWYFGPPNIVEDLRCHTNPGKDFLVYTAVCQHESTTMLTFPNGVGAVAPQHARAGCEGGSPRPSRDGLLHRDGKDVLAVPVFVKGDGQTGGRDMQGLPHQGTLKQQI